MSITTSDSVPDGAVKVVADLADPSCARRIFAGAEGLPPVRLLVNNAARFAFDGFGAFERGRIRRADGGQCARAAAADRRASRRRMTAPATRWWSICSMPSWRRRTPISSATPCPSRRWPALTELAARALAPQGIRVNAIAPALMLRSAGQSEENFAAMQPGESAAARRSRPDDVVAALRYLIDRRR